MNYDFPIEYFEENLIFNRERKECWALYKMDGFNYDYKSNERKISILNALARFLANIGEYAKILIIPISQDVQEHYDRMTAGLNKKDSMYKVAATHANQTAAYLKNKIEATDNANDYKVYIQTKIKLNSDTFNDIKDTMLYFLKEPKQIIEELLGADYKEIFEKDIREFLKLSNDYMKKQSRRLSIKKCDAMDVQWLIRRPMYRGIGSFKLRGNEDNQWSPFVDKVIKDGKIAIRSNKREILSLTEGEIDVSNSKVVKVLHGDGRESIQTFLTIAHIPGDDGIMFPGSEWLLKLQDFPIQTEVCINIHTVEHKESLKNINKKKKEIDDQIEHIIKSNVPEMPDDVLASKEDADALEIEVKNTREPITEASIVLCLFSDKEDELESKVNFIKEYYEDNYFIIERPRTDQLKFFMEFFPGTGRYVTDFIQRIPPRTLAGSMIGATRLLGDNQGPYIGTTGVLNKNVFLEIARACRVNRSASAAFIGTLGGGKSFAANLLFYLSVLYGGIGLVLDPKGERGNWLKDLPEFAGQINIITLSSELEDKGRLDPYIIYKDNFEEASALAMSILTEMFKLNPKDDEYLAILQAINIMKKQRVHSMIQLSKILMELPDEEFRQSAKRIGKRIELMRDMAMAGLLFGNGDEEALSFDKKINILQIQNLSMPSPEKPKDDYTQEELLSTVIMIPIASFARRFMHLVRSIFKCILFDEAWALSATTQGNQMINALMREGRALYAGCLFIGHSTKDMRGEGIKTNMSYKFCFKATDNEEIKRMLDFLDLEETEENINEVKSLENGECLFQDLEGRVGKLKIDAVFEHLIERAFNTNPDKVRKDGGQGEKAS